MRALISNLAPIGPVETQLFNELAFAFNRAGWKSTLWSTVPCPDFVGHVIPFNWDLSVALDRVSISAADTELGLESIDVDMWVARLQRLVKQSWQRDDAKEMLAQLAGYSHAIIQQTAPDLFLAWNPHCPHVGIATDICRGLGIPTALLERGILPETWFLRQGGLLGHDPAANLSLANLGYSKRELGDFKQSGYEYVTLGLFGDSVKYAQSDLRSDLELLEKQHSGRKVVFFPPDDGTVGFVPVDGEDRIRSIPDFNSSFAAASALARHVQGPVIFKPHPSFPSDMDYGNAPENLHVLDCDYRILIEWADVVAGTGSGLELNALIAGKPVVSLANEILRGKGVCVEPSISDLATAVDEAIAAPAEDRKSKLYEVVGWLLTKHLVTLDPKGLGWRKPTVAVADLLAELDLPTVCRRAHQIAAWQDRAGHTTLEEDAESSRYTTALVDVDHTLLLGNSTEIFLDQAWPRSLSWLIDITAKWVHGLPLLRGSVGGLYRDHFRMLVIAALMPWVFFLWPRRARKIGRELRNEELIELLGRQPRRYIAVSNGFGRVLRPLLAGAGIDWPLVSTHLNPRRITVRDEGKIAAIERAHPEIDLDNSIGVSDSMEDAEFLARCSKGHLRQWPDVWSARPAYFPFRFTAEAKYNPSGLFWQVFLTDIPIVLIAFATLGWPILGVALLFVATHGLYEWGYFDNQYGVGRTETEPKRHVAHDKFKTYRIHAGALLWHIPLVGAAMWILGALSLDLMMVWSLVMIGMLLTFLIYNRISTSGRMYMYPVLQCFKYGSFAVVMPLSLVGGLLLFVQITWQTAHYWVYRLGGREAKLPQVWTKLILFGLVLIVFELAIPNARVLLHLQWPRVVAAILILPWTFKSMERLLGDRNHWVRTKFAAFWSRIWDAWIAVCQLLRRPITTPSVAYSCRFDSVESLTNHWHRAIWYLPYVEGLLDRVHFTVKRGIAPGLRPKCMGTVVCGDSHLQITNSRLRGFLHIMTARVVLVWRRDIPWWLRVLGILGWRVVRVETGNPCVHEWGEYARLMWTLRTTEQQREIIHRNHEKLKRVEKEIAETTPKSTILLAGTGPSLAMAALWKCKNAIGIGCNTIVASPEAMDAISIRFLTAGDCVSHFGVSKYAEKFRDQMRTAMLEREIYLLTTAQFGQLLIDHSPELANLTILVPQDVDMLAPNHDLIEDFRLPALDSTLNIHMLPLAATLGSDIHMIGFDGRAPDLGREEDFWEHNLETQYSQALVETGHQCHPTFDMHRKAVTLNRYIRSTQHSMAHMEAHSISVRCLAHSYTPSIQLRNVLSNGWPAEDAADLRAGPIRARDLASRVWHGCQMSDDHHFTLEPGGEILAFVPVDILPGELACGRIILSCNQGATVRVEVGRHGPTPWEGTASSVHLTSAPSELELMHRYEEAHEFMRIRIMNPHKRSIRLKLHACAVQVFASESNGWPAHFIQHPLPNGTAVVEHDCGDIEKGSANVAGVIRIRLDPGSKLIMWRPLQVAAGQTWELSAAICSTEAHRLAVQFSRHGSTEVESTQMRCESSQRPMAVRIRHEFAHEHQNLRMLIRNESIKFAEIKVWNPGVRLISVP